jgi:hypothetical protein
MVGHGRATTAAGVETSAVKAGFHIEVAQLLKDKGVIPVVLERAFPYVAYQKRPFLQEGAGINVPVGGNTTSHLGRSAHIQPFSAPLFRSQTEKGISRADQVMPVKPFRKGLQLLLTGSQGIPGLFPSAGGTEA